MGVYREGFVTLNFVPIRVATWGGWIEDASPSWEEVIIIFSGNPGVVSFYEELCEQLHESTKLPVWVISHAGHELPPDDRYLKIMFALALLFLVPMINLCLYSFIVDL